MFFWVCYFEIYIQPFSLAILYESEKKKMIGPLDECRLQMQTVNIRCSL